MAILVVSNKCLCVVFQHIGWFRDHSGCGLACLFLLSNFAYIGIKNKCDCFVDWFALVPVGWTTTNCFEIDILFYFEIVFYKHFFQIAEKETFLHLDFLTINSNRDIIFFIWAHSTKFIIFIKLYHFLLHIFIKDLAPLHLWNS